MPPRRFIAHLDMDAFYASCELLRYPELRGRPVVIGGGHDHAPDERVDSTSGAIVRSFATLHGYRGRGVITTATYEARALGLRSAMAMSKAAGLAPDTVLLPVDFALYRHYSRLFKQAVRSIATRIEDRGIDEIFIDLTDVVSAQVNEEPASVLARVHRIAQSIKDAVHRATSLSCSMGIARNKLLAKIASELDKPDGLTLIGESDLERRIWPLPARSINGIGPKTAARLDALDIRTIGDLARAEAGSLVAKFGRAHGEWMHEAAHGRDERPVVTESEPRSISRETTFERDLSPRHDRDELATIFTGLCQGVASDLARKGYAGRTIGVKLRYDNFATVTRDRTLPQPTDDPAVIRQVAAECVRRAPLSRALRLLGVRASGLVRGEAIRHVAHEPAPATGNLFD